MKKLQALVADLNTFIPQYQKKAPAISQSSIGWQIEHCLLTINLITKALQQSNPTAFKSKFSLLKMFIFSTKIIPRGKAKAPKIVQPQLVTEQSLHTSFNTVNESLVTLSKLLPNQYFLHPYFGGLKLKSTILFLQIHTNHHLKIIKDISKKA